MIGFRNFGCRGMWYIHNGLRWNIYALEYFLEHQEKLAILQLFHRKKCPK